MTICEDHVAGKNGLSLGWILSASQVALMQNRNDGTDTTPCCVERVGLQRRQLWITTRDAFANLSTRCYHITTSVNNPERF
jgi:hypothetical protein